jgi:hypothetical protein
MIPNGRKIYQHFSFHGPPKYTRIGIFGLKINHLATLPRQALAILVQPANMTESACETGAKFKQSWL